MRGGVTGRSGASGLAKVSTGMPPISIFSAFGGVGRGGAGTGGFISSSIGSRYASALLGTSASVLLVANSSFFGKTGLIGGGGGVGLAGGASTLLGAGGATLIGGGATASFLISSILANGGFIGAVGGLNSASISISSIDLIGPWILLKLVSIGLNSISQMSLYSALARVGSIPSSF